MDFSRNILRNYSAQSGRFPRNRPVKAESWENCAQLFHIREAHLFVVALSSSRNAVSFSSGVHNKTLSVAAVRVGNPDCSSLRING